MQFPSLEELKARGTRKWTVYGDDVLPLWIAESDFPTAPPVMEAIERAGDDVPALDTPPAEAEDGEGEGEVAAAGEIEDTLNILVVGNDTREGLTEQQLQELGTLGPVVRSCGRYRDMGTTGRRRVAETELTPFGATSSLGECYSTKDLTTNDVGTTISLMRATPNMHGRHTSEVDVCAL